MNSRVSSYPASIGGGLLHRFASWVLSMRPSFVALSYQDSPPNQLLQRTRYVFTPFAVAKAAPTQPAAELRR